MYKLSIIKITICYNIYNYKIIYISMHKIIKKGLLILTLCFSISGVAQAEITERMSVGSRGEQVKTLQSFLIELGLLNTQATGYFGPATERAVREFQEDNGLEAVGSVGPMTRGVVNANLNGSTPNSINGVSVGTANYASNSNTLPSSTTASPATNIADYSEITFSPVGFTKELGVKRYEDWVNFINTGVDKIRDTQNINAAQVAFSKVTTQLWTLQVTNIEEIEANYAGAYNAIVRLFNSVPFILESSKKSQWDFLKKGHLQQVEDWKNKWIAHVNNTSGGQVADYSEITFSPVGFTKELGVKRYEDWFNFANSGVDKIRDTQNINAAQGAFSKVTTRLWALQVTSLEEVEANYAGAYNAIVRLFNSVPFILESSKKSQWDFLKKGHLQQVEDWKRTWVTTLQGKQDNQNNNAPVIAGIQGWWNGENRPYVASNTALVLYGKFGLSGNTVVIKDASVAKEYPATVIPASGNVTHDQINIKLGDLFGNKIDVSVKNPSGLSNIKSMDIRVLPTGSVVSIDFPYPGDPVPAGSVTGTLVKPIISSLSSSSGRAGETVTINGSNFTTGLAVSILPTINGSLFSRFPITFISSSKLSFVVPAVTSNIGTGSHSIQLVGASANLTSNTVPFNILSSSDTLPSATPPVIAAIQGYDKSLSYPVTTTLSSNKEMVLYGVFNSSENKVFVNNIEQKTTYQSINQINVTLGTLSGNTATVTVVNSNGGVDKNIGISNSATPPLSPPDSIMVPIITGVQGYNATTGSYSNGSAVAGGTLIIYGTFPSEVTVTVGGVSKTPVSQNSSQINITLGSAIGSLPVKVINKNGTPSNSVAILINAPIVLNTTPATQKPVITGVQGYDATKNLYTTGTVASGQTLIIYGSFDVSGNDVSVNGSPVAAPYQSTTQINVPLNSAQAGNATVSVYNSKGASNIFSFTITTAPAGTVVPPVSGLDIFRSTPVNTGASCAGSAPSCNPKNSCGQTANGVQICTNGVWGGCSEPTPSESYCVQKKCGPGTSASSTGAPTSNLCEVGSASSVMLDTVAKAYVWTCGNSYSSVTKTIVTTSCSKDYVGSINGVCGRSVNTHAPYSLFGNDQESMCYTGTLSSLTKNSDGTFSWRCNGSASSAGVNAGATVACNNLRDDGEQGVASGANAVPPPAPTVVNGVCGGAIYTWSPFVITNINVCNAGVFSGATRNADSTYSWTCTGTGTGATTASCQNVYSGQSNRTTVQNQLANALEALQKLLKQLKN